MGLWPENTLFAFERAVASGVDALDMDVRMSADGVPVVLHDAAVDRTTDGQGEVSELPWSALQALDAGHGWSRDGGRTHPHRGQGLTIPSVSQVLRAFPDVPLGLEIKQEGRALAQRLCEVIRAAGGADRVLVASFRAESIEAFRAACPGVATSASFGEALGFFVWTRLGLDAQPPRARAFQVPLRLLRVEIPTRRFVSSAHRLGLRVQAWVANEIEDMRRLRRAGVDGIITDYPDRLLALLARDRGPDRGGLPR